MEKYPGTMTPTRCVLELKSQQGHRNEVNQWVPRGTAGALRQWRCDSARSRMVLVQVLYVIPLSTSSGNRIYCEVAVIPCVPRRKVGKEVSDRMDDPAKGVDDGSSAAWPGQLTCNAHA